MQHDVQLKIDDDMTMVLDLGRICEQMQMPWVEAGRLAGFMTILGTDKEVQKHYSGKIVSAAEVQNEAGQWDIKYDDHGQVSIFVKNVDRINFTSLESVSLFINQLKRAVQDCWLKQKGMKLEYKNGRISRILRKYE